MDMEKHSVKRTINTDNFFDFSKVMKGDRFENIRVINIGNKGDGIAKLKNGIVVIIKDKTLRKHDTVDIEITVVKDKFVFAKIV